MAVIRKRKGDGAFSSRLRHRLTVERATDAANGADVTQVWHAVREIWVDVEPLTGREFYQRDTPIGDITHSITVRWEDANEIALTIKDRFRRAVDGRTYNVVSIRNIGERDRVAVISAKEVA